MKKVIFVLMLLASALALCACNPNSPTTYTGTVWVCEEPYMQFTASQDEFGTSGIGEIQTEDGEMIEARFYLSMYHCYIFKEEDVYLETTTVGGREMITTNSEEAPILSGDYKMSRHDTVTKVTIVDDQIYGGKYSVLEFHRQANGYVKFMSGQKYGFVGLDRATGEITTFHIKTVSELARIAPSLGFGM